MDVDDLPIQNFVMMAPREQLMVQRLNTAKSLLQMGTQTSNLNQAEKYLRDAADMLEGWLNNFDDELDEDDITTENPYSTLLAQARHRLGQVALLRGRMGDASRLFLQVILHDPDSLSPSALAMTWYDVGLIYMSFGRIAQAQAALQQAYTTIITMIPPPQQQLQHLQQASSHDTLLLFIEQAMLRLYEVQDDDLLQGRQLSPLPWSIQFTVVTYNYGDPPLGQFQNVHYEASLLMDPTKHAAGAA